MAESCPETLPDLLEEVPGTCIHLLDCFYTKES